MADFVEVVDAGPGWTKVLTSDGEVVTVEGNRNWRNNNPGNLEYGDFARSMGAVGTDGRFAVFPSYETGRTAKERLIFESPNYRDLSLSDAISRYAPAFENDTAGYLRQVAEAAGVSPNTPMSQIPPELRPAVLDAMQRVEGWKVGTINGSPVTAPPRPTNQNVRLPAIAPPPAVTAINRAAPQAPRPAPRPQTSPPFWSNPLQALQGATAGLTGPLMASAASPQVQQAAIGPLMGSLAGRTLVAKHLMGMNIGASPTMTPGHSGVGTRAVAVGRNAGPVMLSSGSGGGANRPQSDGRNPAGMNMDVYRSNAAVLGGGGFNQSNIDRVLSGGGTLVKLA